MMSMREDILHSLIAGLDPAIQADVQRGLRRRLDARVNPRIQSGDAHEGSGLETQQHFATALLNPEQAVPFPAKRFAVYRNNVVVGLVDALAARFPATQRIVGEEFFRAMARVYARAHPPRSPLMMFYGDWFPDFIAGFEPAADVPYLADVARLEAARTRAYHAADAAPADPGPLQALGESEFGAARVVRHPSAEIVRSQYPLVAIWSMNAGGAEVQPIEQWRGEDALVARPRGEVEVRLLPAGGAKFLWHLFAGLPFGAAAEAAEAEFPEFDPIASLAALIASGAAAKFILPDGEKMP